MTLTRRSFLSITAVAAALTAAVVYGSDSGGASSASGNNLIIWADQKKADSLTEFAKKWGEQQGLFGARADLKTVDLIERYRKVTHGNNKN